MVKKLGSGLAASGRYVLNTDGLANGIYFCAVETEQGRVMKKFSVNR